MPTLYLNRCTTSVNREGEHLVIKQRDLPDTIPQFMPLHEITSVIVIGEPSITFPVLSCFIQRQIPISFLSPSGHWRGCIDTSNDNYGQRRSAQYHHSANLDFTLPMAKALISAKLYNSLRLLQRLEASHGEKLHLNSEDHKHKHLLKWISKHLATCRTATALRGIEGLAAVHYFALLCHHFPNEIAFTKRQRHPAKDPANALLSWTYTLLQTEISNLLRHHHLDPAIGLLHVNANRSPALALDLMEPFRPAFADRLVLNLLNRRILQVHKHFVTNTNGAVLLNEPGRAAFFSAYENTLTRTFVNPKTGQNTTMREIFHQHILDYIRYLEAPLGSMTPPASFRLP